jgi:hypothetical protein
LAPTIAAPERTSPPLANDQTIVPVPASSAYILVPVAALEPAWTTPLATLV